MPKLLGEFLQEQQEPFALDVYLLERGYSIRKALDSNPTCPSKRRRAIRSCSKFVRAVISWLELQNDQRIKNSRNGKRREPREHADHEDMHFSCSESLKVVGKRKLQWISMEDSSDKQSSPVSVLEETDQTDKGSPQLHQKQYNLRPTKRGCSTSTSQCRSKHSTSVQELQEQYSINKRETQQSKQLLVECVRELVIESHRRKDEKTGYHLKKILGTNELFGNAWQCSQYSTDETNKTRLLHYDFMASEQGRKSALEQQREEIYMEIGDAILDVIINEVVTI